MANENVNEIDVGSLCCKVVQVAGVIAALAQSQASREEIGEALWGALALANEARGMALAIAPEAAG